MSTRLSHAECASSGLGWLLIALIGVAGCQRPAEEQRTGTKTVDDVVAAVPDSAMRERWRQASASGRLPSLDSLPVPAEPLSQRVPAVAQDTPARQTSPTIPQGTIATVQPHSSEPLSEYRGPFVATDVGVNRIVGRLQGRQAPLELYYRLPTGQALDVRTSDSLTLTLESGVVDGSMRQVVHLRGTNSAAVLLFVSDGSRTPYSRRFEDIPLVVTQVGPGRDNVAAVSVTFSGQSFRLLPGDRRQARDANGSVELFLQSSFFTPPDRVALAEGDPYHVTLLVYRVGSERPPT